MGVIADQLGSRLLAMRWNFHCTDYAITEREELEVEVGNILGKEVGEL
jgi:hypothetical protein